MSIIINPRAFDDIDTLTERFQAARELTAKKFALNIRSDFELLESQPEIGSKLKFRVAYGVPLRSFAVRGFPNVIIIYKPIAGGVEIVRVLDGRRNLKSRLFD
jgi:plasmid stabilization system protein ParE